MQTKLQQKNLIVPTKKKPSKRVSYLIHTVDMVFTGIRLDMTVGSKNFNLLRTDYDLKLVTVRMMCHVVLMVDTF
jgi:hypothetical protein